MTTNDFLHCERGKVQLVLRVSPRYVRIELFQKDDGRYWLVPRAVFGAAMQALLDAGDVDDLVDVT